MTTALFLGVRTADGEVMSNPDSMVQEAETSVSQFTTESHRKWGLAIARGQGQQQLAFMFYGP